MLFTRADRARLVHVEAMLVALTQQGSKTMADLSTQIKAAGTDPAALAALAAAVAANTPAAPATP